MRGEQVAKRITHSLRQSQTVQQLIQQLQQQQQQQQKQLWQQTLILFLQALTYTHTHIHLQTRFLQLLIVIVIVIMFEQIGSMRCVTVENVVLDAVVLLLLTNCTQLQLPNTLSFTSATATAVVAGTILTIPFSFTTALVSASVFDVVRVCDCLCLLCLQQMLKMSCRVGPHRRCFHCCSCC